MTNTISTLDGQLSLFDSATIGETFEMEYCPACRSNWGVKLAPKAKQNLYQEHEMQPDGRCQRMHTAGTTEPYYKTIEEMKSTRSCMYLPEQVVLRLAA